MRKWLYTIKNGTKLRKKILYAKTDEDRADIILTIRDCCKEVINKFSKDCEDVVYPFEELYYLTEGDDDIIRNGEYEEYGLNDAEELINERLVELYDICDEHSIFVAL